MTSVNSRVGTYHKSFFFSFLFLPCNAKLLHTSNIELYKWQTLHSLNLLINLSSKFVGVGLNFALLKDNYLVTPIYYYYLKKR